MKTVTLLLLVSTLFSLNSVLAEEESGIIDDYNAYCTEQAQLSGIEDPDELKQFVQDCLDSYTGTSGDQ
jgi:hypothetical protein